VVEPAAPDAEDDAVLALPRPPPPRRDEGSDVFLVHLLHVLKSLLSALKREPIDVVNWLV
jgi:hypothetical protein